MSVPALGRVYFISIITRWKRAERRGQIGADFLSFIRTLPPLRPVRGGQCYQGAPEKQVAAAPLLARALGLAWTTAPGRVCVLIGGRERSGIGLQIKHTFYVNAAASQFLPDLISRAIHGFAKAPALRSRNSHDTLPKRKSIYAACVRRGMNSCPVNGPIPL